MWIFIGIPKPCQVFLKKVFTMDMISLLFDLILIPTSWRDFLAFMSAFSFPTIPTCLGPYPILIILLIRFFLTELDPPIAISALRLSEKITKLELSWLLDSIQIKAWSIGVNYDE